VLNNLQIYAVGSAVFAGLTAVIAKVGLLFAVVIAVLFLGEWLSLNQWGGAILMSFGALLIAFK